MISGQFSIVEIPGLMFNKGCFRGVFAQCLLARHCWFFRAPIDQMIDVCHPFAALVSRMSYKELDRFQK